MSTPSQTLESLNIFLPDLPQPLGSYVPAVKSGNLVFVSGQLPLKDGELLMSGKVDKAADIEPAAKAAGQCFINALATLAHVGTGIDQVARVVKITGYVQSSDDFHQQPMVINGASDLSKQVFGDSGTHARAAVGVNSLPMNAAVELEVIFELRA